MTANQALTLLIEATRAANVVGGRGQPFADRLQAKPYRTLIINACQSEPLIYRDWAAIAHFGACVLDGARLLLDATGIQKAFLAVRDEFAHVLPTLRPAARDCGVALSRLPDTYPLSHPQLLKRELLGIAPTAAAGNDVLVVNAETLRNVSWAMRRGYAVITKLLTVSGAVARPLTLQAPIGLPFADCLALAGGATCDRYVVFADGVLGGHQIDADQSCVTATTQGFVVLPISHSVVQAPRPDDAMAVRLAERRQAFLSSTTAGRTQPMSAAYALFDLTRYQRARQDYIDAFAARDTRQRHCGAPAP